MSLSYIYVTGVIQSRIDLYDVYVVLWTPFNIYNFEDAF